MEVRRGVVASLNKKSQQDTAATRKLGVHVATVATGALNPAGAAASAAGAIFGSHSDFLSNSAQDLLQNKQTRRSERIATSVHSKHPDYLAEKAATEEATHMMAMAEAYKKKAAAEKIHAEAAEAMAAATLRKAKATRKETTESPKSPGASAAVAAAASATGGNGRKRTRKYKIQKKNRKIQKSIIRRHKRN